jgi:hypothetical protein
MRCLNRVKRVSDLTGKSLRLFSRLVSYLSTYALPAVRTVNLQLCNFRKTYMTTYTVQLTQISNVLHNSKHETTSYIYILCYFLTQLTPRIRVLLEKLIFTNSSPSMEPKRSLPYSQEPAKRICTEPVEFTQQTHTISISVRSSDLRLRVPNRIFPSSSPVFCTYFSQLRSVPLPNLSEQFTHVFKAPTYFDIRLSSSRAFDQ